MASYTWTPETLIHYPLVSAVSVAPDGASIAYTVRIPYMTDDTSEFRHQLWKFDLDHDTGPQLLAFGESAEQPRWSPDGKHIAFLRKLGPKRRTGIWIMAMDGGEPWPVTAAEPIHDDVIDCRWSPDGERIAFLAVPIDAAKEERTKARDDTVHWRVDDQMAQAYVATLTSPGENPPAPLLRTRFKRHIRSLSWSPDGTMLALAHQGSSNHNSWRDLTLATVPADGQPGTPQDLGRIASRDSAPLWSPDGRWIACEASSGPNRWPYAGTIRLFSAQDGTHRDLASVSDEEPYPLGWDASGAGVYVLNQTGISTQVDFLPSDGSAAVTVCKPEKMITTVDVTIQGKVAMVAQDFSEPQSIYVAELSADVEVDARKVVAPLSDYPSGPLPQVKLLSWTTPDEFEIEGILYLPDGYDASANGPLPLLLHIHGGPTSIFQRQFSATPYYYTPAALCERGIAVLRCNPRGSGGYGKAFRSANVRDWGRKDYEDLQQGVDTIIEMGVADEARLGIAGWSYGGFMTSWTITQTDRFKAASIGAAVTNLATFCATADITDFVPDYFGGEAWEIPEVYRRHSPITHVANAQTPSIVQHGGADERVPLEQGLQYFNALQRRGVPVDMYIYPRQGHAIEEPRLLADAIQRNLDWFSHMLVDADSA